MIRPSCDPILLIRSANSGETKLIDYFKSMKMSWVEVGRFAEAQQARSGNHFGLVVCDWELFQSSQSDRDECLTCSNLLRAAEPLIFISARQSVAVNFKSLMGRCFYSLKEAESCGLFQRIAELASQVSAQDRDAKCPEPVEEKTWSARTGQGAYTPAYLPAPHFPLGQTLSPTLANSSVHALY